MKVFLGTLFFCLMCITAKSQVFSFECVGEYISGADCPECTGQTTSRLFNGLAIKRSGAYFKNIDCPYIVKQQGSNLIFQELINPNPETVTINLLATSFSTINGFKDSTACMCAAQDSSWIGGGGDPSITNEGILGVAAGGANDALLTSNTSTAVGVTYEGSTTITVTETPAANGGTITFQADTSLLATINDIRNNTFDTVSTYADLRLYDKGQKLIYVSGHGIEGFFERIAPGPADDDGTVIVGDYSWERVYDRSALNVQWYGAVGDSTTDDYAAIQAAIDVAMDRTNTTVYFPRGKYRYTQTLSMYKPVGVSIVGAGMDNTYLLPVNVTGIYVRTDSTELVTGPKYGVSEGRDMMFKDFSMLRVGTNSYANQAIGIHVLGTFNRKMENIRVEEFFATSGGASGKGIGIKIDNPYDAVGFPALADEAVQHNMFENVYVNECDTGIVFRLMNTVNMQDVKIDESKKVGIVLKNGVVWKGGMVQASVNCGIYITEDPFPIKQIYLDGIHFESNSRTNPKYGTIYKGSATTMTNFEVVNCRFSQADSSKIFNLRRVRYANITNNTYAVNAYDTLYFNECNSIILGNDNYYEATTTSASSNITFLSGNLTVSTEALNGLTLQKDAPGPYALNVGGTAIVDDNLGVGTTGLPARKFHVQGEGRITDLTTDTPTRVVGADADGDLGAVGLAAGLSIVAGVLTPADNSPTNEVETFVNTSDATSHTVTLAPGTTSVQLIEGANVTMTTGGTAANGTVTIAATPHNYSSTRTLPTTVGNTVQLGFFNQAHGIGNYEVMLSADASGVAVSKYYLVSTFYNSTSSVWQILPPITSTGAFSGHDFVLEVKGINQIDSLRVRRTAGITAATLYVDINYSAQATVAFTALSGTDNPTAITAVYSLGALSQMADNVGVKTVAPAQDFHVEGTARITGSDGTATALVGRDADGDISAVGLASGLSISAGTLTPADNSATNEAWTVDADAGDTEVISNQTLLFAGGGIVSTSYNAAGNTLTVTGTEVDGSTSNEIQTITGGGSGTTYALDLSLAGGSIGLIEGTGITIDRTGNDFTFNSTASGGTNYQTWRDDGVAATLRPNANFVSNTDIAFTLTDDAGNTETEVTADIPANAVDNAELRQSAALSVIGRSANSTGDVADIAAAADGDVLRRSGSTLGFGDVDLTLGVTGTLPVGNGGTGANTFVNNRVLTGNGTSAIVDEANLTFDGTTLSAFSNANSATNNIVINNSNAGSSAVGALRFWNNSSTSNTRGFVSQLASSAFSSPYGSSQIHWLYENANQIWATNNGARMMLNASGNLYIGGAVSGSEKLHVSGNAYVTGNISAGVQPALEALHINGNGYITANLGVGVQPALAKIHASGTSNTTMIVQSSNTIGTTFNVKNTSVGGGDFTFSTTGSANTYPVGSFLAYDVTAAQTRYWVDASGNFGVTNNTSLPAKFFVEGSGATSATMAATFENSAGSDILNVRDDQRVGIITATPNRTLEVAGEVRITDLVTDTPTKIVGADGDGDLDTIGIGAENELHITAGTLGTNFHTTISPATLTTTTNNWNPTGLSTAWIIELSGNGSFVLLTGITAPSFNKTLTLYNSGDNSILLPREFPTSSAGNRFAFEATLFPGKQIEIRYSTGEARWLLKSKDGLYDDVQHLYANQLFQSPVSITTGDFDFWEITSEAAASVVAPTSGVWSGVSVNTGADAGGLGYVSSKEPFLQTDNSSGTVTWGYCKAVIRTPSSLSDGSNDYAIRVGFNAANGGGGATNGMYFQYNHGLVSGNWGTATTNAGNTQLNNSGVAVATSTVYVLEMYVQPGLAVSFFINGVRVATNDTFVNTGDDMYISAEIEKSIGTSQRDLQIFTLQGSAALVNQP